MTLEEATRRLREAGYEVHEKERLPNETGWKLRLLSPQIVSVYDTGKTQVQGKPPTDLRALLNAASSKG